MEVAAPPSHELGDLLRRSLAAFEPVRLALEAEGWAGYVAIDSDRGVHVTGPTYGAAFERFRSRHPDPRPLVFRVGRAGERRWGWRLTRQWHAAEAAERAPLARALYAPLRDGLEGTRRGEFVAFDVTGGGHEVAPTAGEALAALARRCPAARPFVLEIGAAPAESLS